MPLGNTVMVPGELTVRVNAFVAGAPALSVTCTVNEYAPAAVGVPLSSPARKPESVDRVVPGGVLPTVTAQFLYGVTPLVAEKACAYGTPTVPAGSGDEVIIVNPEGWLMAMDRLRGGETVPVLSLTMTVKTNGLPVAELGTPLIMPDDAFSVSPGGSAPELR